MAKKQTKEETTEATTEAQPVEKQPKQNGVSRPRSGTATGRVWEIADSLSASAGSPATRADVMQAGKAESLNEATIATQYGRWRKFHGLIGAKAPSAAATAEETTEAPATAEA